MKKYTLEVTLGETLEITRTIENCDAIEIIGILEYEKAKYIKDMQDAEIMNISDSNNGGLTILRDNEC